MSSARNDPKNVFLWKYENHEFPGKTGETVDFRSAAFSMIFKRKKTKNIISQLSFSRAFEWAMYHAKVSVETEIVPLLEQFYVVG